MKERLLKKSDVLREGYVKGLKEAQRVINEMIEKNAKGEDVIFEQSRDEYERTHPSYEEAPEEDYAHWADANWERFLIDYASFLNRKFWGIVYGEKSASGIEEISVLAQIEEGLKNGILSGDELVIKFLDNGALCISSDVKKDRPEFRICLIGVDEDKMYNKRGDEVVSEYDIRKALVTGDRSSKRVNRCLISLRKYYEP